MESSKLQVRSRRKNYLSSIEDFFALTRSIQEGTYSDRNQLQFAFSQIRRKFNFAKQVEKFVTRAEEVFKANKHLAIGFTKI